MMQDARCKMYVDSMSNRQSNMLECKQASIHNMTAFLYGYMSMVSDDESKRLYTENCACMFSVYNQTCIDMHV